MGISEREIKIKELNNIWGKTNPFHPLICHMIDVGLIMYELLLSKSFQPSVNILQRLMEPPKDFSDIQFYSWMSVLASIHDIGKCSPDFQAKGPGILIDPLKRLGLPFRTTALTFVHNELSGKWIKQLLEDAQWSRKSSYLMQLILHGHHGYFSSNNSYEEEEILSKSWNPVRKQMLQILNHLFKAPFWKKTDNFEDANPIGVLTLGLIVLSDWIASNVELYNFSALTKNEFQSFTDIQTYYNSSRNLAQKNVSNLGFNDILTWDNITTFNDLWNFPSLFPVQKLTQNLLQDKIFSEQGYKFFIIEGSMGEGKTESALLITTQLIKKYNLSGMFIALPTMATSNQMYTRIKEFISSQNSRMALSVKLIHSMAWIIDDIGLSADKIADVFGKDTEDTLLVSEWFKPSKRGLLSNYAVGTIDQVLMSVLHTKFTFLRLLGLSNKVLIIDEVHAYDIYMNQILKRFLEWAFILDIPVILLSATLPYSKKVDLIKSYFKNNAKLIPKLDNQKFYPLITSVSKNGELNIVHDEFPSPKEKKLNLSIDLSKNINSLADDVLKRSYYACICVMFNTVKRSQEFYKILKAKADENELKTDIILFHARFPIDRRTEIEKEVLVKFGKNSYKRPSSAILIATQIVEQSLDIDFDLMFSEIAPIDLIIQRSGRIQRHERGSRKSGAPTMLLFSLGRAKSDFDLSEIIYSKYILLKTLAVIFQINELKIPSDIRQLIERVYETTIEELILPDYISKYDLEISEKEWKKDLAKDANLANKYLTPSPIGKNFTYGTHREVIFKEDEENANDYIYAKTRVGTLTEQIIILFDKEFEGIENNLIKKLEKDEIKKLFQKTIPISKNWLKDIEFPKINIFWLKHKKILRFQSVPSNNSENKDYFYYRNNNKEKIEYLHYNPIIGLEKSSESRGYL